MVKKKLPSENGKLLFFITDQVIQEISACSNKRTRDLKSLFTPSNYLEKLVMSSPKKTEICRSIAMYCLPDWICLAM